MKILKLWPMLGLCLSALTGCSLSNVAQLSESRRFAEQQTEYWAVEVVHDDQTLTLMQGDQQEEAVLCGLRPPDLGHPIEKASLDYLKQLLGKSAEREVGVVPVGRDPLGRLVAEVFVATGGAEEIHVNSQMVLDGMVTVDDTSRDCPNSLVIATAEGRAKEAGAGMWHGESAGQ